EGMTAKNTRHCVNSVSIKFVPDTSAATALAAATLPDAPAKKDEPKTEKAIFAGGCFWGVEYHFQKAKGVISTKVGYIGGHKDNPTYEDVCSHTTGHYEAMEVTYDPSKTTFRDMAKLFFEIHDPTEWNHQGPDHGEQYRSAVFYLSDEQKKTTEELIDIL